MAARRRSSTASASSQLKSDTKQGVFSLDSTAMRYKWNKTNKREREREREKTDKQTSRQSDGNAQCDRPLAGSIFLLNLQREANN